MKKQLSALVGVSDTTILRILHDHLGVTKVSARWVPRMLTPLQKQQRVDASKQFLELCGDEPAQILERIATGDETWVHHFESESKQESMQWHKKGTPPPKIFKVSESAGKLMALVFWDFLKNISQDIDNLTVAEAHFCDTESCNHLMNTSSNNSLNIITQNIRSIYKNIDNFIVHLSRLSVTADVIILTECWLCEHKPPPAMNGYTYYFSKILHNQNDGIVIYVRDGLRCAFSEPEGHGGNFAVLKLNPDIVLICTYRSPSFYNADTFLDSLDGIIRPIRSANVCLLGDMNIDIKRGNNDRNSSSYLNLMAELGLLPGHYFPTRVNNCLDHILIKTKFGATVIVMDSTVTDHASVLLSLSLGTPKLPSDGYYVRTNLDAALDYIKNTDFSFITLSTNADLAASSFVEKLSFAIITSTSKEIKIPVEKELLSPGSPLAHFMKICYKRYRNFCNSLIRKLKIQYERSLIQNASNNKQTWSALREIVGTSNNKVSPKELLHKGDEPFNAVTAVNNYFANIGSNLASNIERSYSSTLLTSKTPFLPNSMAFLPPDEAEVRSIINSLKTNCAVGYDMISSKLLKLSKDIIVPPLTILLKLCFEQGIFPKVFKRALVTPVHKGGSREDVTNYRPISVLTSLSKILEIMLNKRLMNFLEKFKILSNNQFGFRPKKSTVDAVRNLTDYVTNHIDSGHKCIGIFLDLAKAFDTLSTPALVEKLERIGIRGTALSIYTSFLTGRTQQVKIDNIISNEAPVTYGVPQGSGLGPTLFLIYINDLCQMTLTAGKVFTYADDTAVVFHGATWEDVRDRAQEGLLRITGWLRTNRLTLNIKKTTFLQFTNAKISTPDVELRVHTCHPSMTDSCACLSILRSSTIKYLSVLIDDKLGWRQHIELLTARIRKLIWIFKKLRDVVDLDTLRSVYYALVQSILSYCVVVWGGASKSHMILVERAQRSLLKTMTYSPYRFPTVELYKKCSVLTVRQLFIMQSIVRQHQYTPYEPSVSSSKRVVRNVIVLPKVRTALARKQSNYLSIYLYNRANRILNYYTLSLKELKAIVFKWLSSLDYQKTEDLLKACWS
ncbi:uncharacterized protein LOC123654751 [Melitaea cinxia]|uniref:uncharacterized protein LOC123654751 n=1 Tax=Melitaea cinxia TaxID=113334 RepID=UPI001E26F441|nr:uncharacterized protein LOC123654751 [Melitaea cinxia]